MSLAYDQYLAEHIGNVNKGLHWMLDNLGLSQEEKTAIETAMVSFNHDESKYSTEEYDAYDKYFYGGNRSYKVVLDFNYAWLHHIHNNPHHWQYWVLLEDDPESDPALQLAQIGTGEHRALLSVMPIKFLMIPMPYIFEMIADWWSFSWKSGNLFEIFNWYADHRSKQYIHPSSRRIIEKVLEKIWDSLIMQETIARHDISEIEGQYKRFWAEQDAAAFNGYTFVPSGTIPDNVTMESNLEPVPDVKSTLPRIGMNGVFGTSYTNRFIEEMNNIKHSDEEDDEDLYGVPELKKFPMPDKKHVKSAIRFFNYVDPKYEKELAEAILEKAKEFGLVFDENITVGEDNRFRKYLKKEDSQIKQPL